MLSFNFGLALKLVRQLDRMVFVGPFQLNYSALILKFNSDFIFKQTTKRGNLTQSIVLQMA